MQRTISEVYDKDQALSTVPRTDGRCDRVPMVADGMCLGAGGATWGVDGVCSGYGKGVIGGDVACLGAGQGTVLGAGACLRGVHCKKVCGDDACLQYE